MRRNFAQEIRDNKKYCSTCRQLLDASTKYFRSSHSARTGLSNKCRACYASDPAIEDIQPITVVTESAATPRDRYLASEVMYRAKLDAIYCVNVLGLLGVAEEMIPFFLQLGMTHARQLTMPLASAEMAQEVRTWYTGSFAQWFKKFIRWEHWRTLGIPYRGREQGMQDLQEQLEQAKQEKFPPFQAEIIDTEEYAVV